MIVINDKTCSPHISYLIYMPFHPLKPIVDWIFRILYFLSRIQNKNEIQSGASSHAKKGGAYFSAVYGSIEDPVAAPGHCKPQVG